MTSFKFNFSGDCNESKNTDDNEIEWFKSEEIIPNTQIEDIEDLTNHARMFTCRDVEIGHVLVNSTMNYMKEKGIKNVLEFAEKEHSDLVTGKYEGGLKIWECTYDLIEYFEDNTEIVNFQDKKVLDLGCGAGILGIYALLKGAVVTFQDYNKEIIEYSTIPNVLLNIEEDDKNGVIKKCKFYSGDWQSFDCLLDSEKFDIILTAETIYNPNNYDKLISLFQNRLITDGNIFIAAKTYYFGVGGGTRQFELALKDSPFKNKVMWKTNSGIQREIIQINKL